MHLQFKSITLNRFRSFLNEATLHFDHAGPGLYFLKGKNNSSSTLGSNGAGKSTIVDGLLWCLYGKTVQGLKNPDIIPWTGKGKTYVEVTLKIDKDVNVIKRTVNPNLLTLNGKEVGQDYIDNLIAIPFEIILYTIILGQRKPLFFDLTASEKLKLFFEVLQLDRWEVRSAHASELTKNLEKEIATKQSELDASLNALEQASSDFTSLKQQSSVWEAERADKLANAEDDRKLLQHNIDNVMNERDTADLKLERAETELRASPIETLRKQYNVALNEIVKFEEVLKTAVRSKARYDAELISVEESICPTCHQETNKELTKKLRIDLTKNIKTCNEQIVDCTKSIETSKKIRDQTLEKFDIEEKAANNFKQEAIRARDILDRLTPKIVNWEAQIKAIEKTLQEVTEGNNPYTEQLQTLRRRRDQNKVLIKQAEETIKTKAEYCERVRYWIKGFKDIKLLQVEEILQELEIVTNCMMEEIGLVGWQIKYDIERETKAGTIARGLNITVLSPNNKNVVKWECWSGGEGQRLRLVGTEALASVLLNHVGVSVNLSIYDEPTTGLSKEGISDLVELLSQRAKETNKSMWLVDHHSVLSSKFIQTILVTKDNNGSTLETL